MKRFVFYMLLKRQLNPSVNISIYHSEELHRIQSKAMHDLHLLLREAEISLRSKYNELKYFDHETSSSSLVRSRSETISINLIQKVAIHDQQQP